MTKNQMKKCLWILDLIYRTGGISYKEISDRWERDMSDDYGRLSNSTFRTYIRQIEDIFDLNIDCVANDGYKYRISSDNDLNKESARSRLLSAFSVNNLLKNNRLEGRIIYEAIPSKEKFLLPILEAMTDGREMEIHHVKFADSPEDEADSVYRIQPYCVKIYKNRWYVLAKTEKGRMRNFALDRITKAKILDTVFTIDPNFDAEEYYRGSFGVIVDEELDIETVRIKAYGKWAKYLRSLPLHSSQKEISQKEISQKAAFSIFEYKIRPTDDFFTEVASFGDKIEVLEPQWVRNEIEAALFRAASIYKAR